MELLATILVTALITSMSVSSKSEIEQGVLNVVFYEETGRSHLLM